MRKVGVVCVIVMSVCVAIAIPFYILLSKLGQVDSILLHMSDNNATSDLRDL